MADLFTLGLKADSTDIKRASSDMDGLTKSGKKLEKQNEETKKSFTALGGKAKKLSESAKSTKKEIVALGGAVAAFIATGAIAAIGKSALSAASDLEETQGKFDVVFKGMTKSAEVWSSKLQKSYAMSETESKKYLSNIQDLIVPTGMARDKSAELSNEFVKMASDLGSFNNLPTEKVIMDIQSALAGGSETLTKYGINVKVAQVRQEALNMGLIQGTEKLSAAHRVQAIYNIMMREGSDAIGDMARTQNSYANQSKKLSANIEDITASIGKGLLPASAAIISRINDWVASNKDLTNSLGVKVVSGISALVGSLRFLENGFLGLKLGGTLAIDSIAQSMKFLFGGVRKLLFAFDQMFKGLQRFTDIENPFDKIEQSLETFSLSSRDVTKEVLSDIQKTNTKYDSMQAALVGIQTELKNSQVEHKNTSTAAKDSADYQKKQAEETAKVQKNLTEDQIKLNVALGKQVKDTWRMRDAEGKKAYKRLGKYGEEYFRDTTETIDNVDSALDTFFDDLDNSVSETTDFGKQAFKKLFGEIKKDGEITTGSLSDTFGKWASNLVTGEFSNIKDAWSSLWKSMLGQLVETTASMAVSWAASKVGNLFKGWNIFHSGAWTLKDDEVPSILQKDEMVVPAGYADQIRDNLGSSFAGDFQGLVDATGGFASKGTAKDSSLSAAAVGALFDGFKETSVQALAQTVLGGPTSIEGLVGSNIGNTSVGLMGIATDHMQAAQTNAHSFLGQSSGFTDIGQLIGKVGGLFGMSGSPVSGLIGGFTGLLGGAIGNTLGDALDARSYESLRDAVESGLMSKSEAHTFGMEATNVGMDKYSGFFGKTVGKTLDALSSGISTVTGGISGFIGSLLDKITPKALKDLEFGMALSKKMGGFVGAMGEWGHAAQLAVDAFSRDIFESLGLTGLLGGTYGGNLSDAPGGSEASDADNQGAQGGGISGGGFAGHGTDADAAENDSGFFASGISSVPSSGSYYLHEGERVISASNNTPDNDVALLVRRLTDIMRQTQIQIVTNTKQTAKILKQFDFDGLPETRT